MSTTMSRNARCAAFIANAPYLAIFSSAPSGDNPGTELPTGGANTYIRRPAGWSTVTNGVAISVTTFNIDNTDNVGYYGFFSAASAGTYFDGGTLSASQVFNANGTVTVTITHTES
jgi:hypothetical protein